MQINYSVNFTTIKIISWCAIPMLFIISLVFNNISVGWDEFMHIHLFYLLSSIVLIICLLLQFFYIKNFQTAFGNIDKSVLLFSAYIMLLSFMGNKNYGLIGEPIRITFFLLLLYFIFKHCLSTNRGQKVFLHSILLLGLFTALHGIGQHFGHFPSNSPLFSITGFFNNPGPYAAYLIALLPLTLASIRENNCKFIRTVAILSVIIISTALILAQSRAAWIAGILSVLFLYKNHLNIKRYLIGGWYTLTFLFFVLLILLFFFKIDSAQGRLLIWKVSYSIWQDNPILGIGPGRFGIEYNNYQVRFFKDSTENIGFERLADNTYHAFNEILQISAQTGIVGLLLFLLFLFTIFRKNKFEQELSVTHYARATILAICIFGLFSYPFSNTAVMLVFTSCVAYLSVHDSSQNNVRWKPLGIKIFHLISIILLCAYIFFSYQKYIAIQEWKSAYSSLEPENGSSAFDSYRKIYPALQNHGGFLFNYGAELSEAGLHHESIPVLEKTKQYLNHIDLYIFLGNSYKATGQYEQAEEAYLHASYMIPNRFVPKYLLVQLYKEQGKTDEALAFAKKIDSMEVKVNSSIVSAIKREMKELISEHEKNI